MAKKQRFSVGKVKGAFDLVLPILFFVPVLLASVVGLVITLASGVLGWLIGFAIAGLVVAVGLLVAYSLSVIEQDPVVKEPVKAAVMS